MVIGVTCIKEMIYKISIKKNNFIFTITFKGFSVNEK